MRSGQGQTGAVGGALAQQIVARVLAADNLGVQGLVVTFAVASGAGTLSSTSVVTDANGDAAVTWTLGSGLGPQSVTATAAGVWYLYGGALGGAAGTVTAFYLRVRRSARPR